MDEQKARELLTAVSVEEPGQPWAYSDECILDLARHRLLGKDNIYVGMYCPPQRAGVWERIRFGPGEAKLLYEVAKSTGNPTPLAWALRELPIQEFEPDAAYPLEGLTAQSIRRTIHDYSWGWDYGQLIQYLVHHIAEKRFGWIDRLLKMYPDEIWGTILDQPFTLWYGDTPLMGTTAAFKQFLPYMSDYLLNRLMEEDPSFLGTSACIHNVAPWVSWRRLVFIYQRRKHHVEKSSLLDPGRPLKVFWEPPSWHNWDNTLVRVTLQTIRTEKTLNKGHWFRAVPDEAWQLIMDFWGVPRPQPKRAPVEVHTWV